MNEYKKQQRKNAKQLLERKGIVFQSFNNDFHWRIGTINFYPTTGLWRDESNDSSGEGVKSMVSYINPPKVNNSVKTLTVEQIFEIAKHSKNKSLFGICESIHKEIYK